MPRKKKYPIVYPTVDMALLDLERNRVLLGRKPGATLWRFPGGFADKFSDSFEGDAIRELQEEANVRADNIEYIGSTIIDDPRYRNTEDAIKTTFFVITKWTGEPKAGDDLEEVAWYDLDTLHPSFLVPYHQVLRTMLLNWRWKYVDGKKTS